MTTVGIIANPASGKDIRRLVAYGSVFDNREKINIVRRVLTGLNALGVERVLYMPEYFGIVPQAVQGLRLDLAVEPLCMQALNSDRDSLNAASLMRQSGVGCIVTLGGDGTNRVVAKACGQVPLTAISTGTNNVFPGLVEGTVAGMAAALVARGLVEPEISIKRRPRLDLRREEDGKRDIALIDAAVHESFFTASRAIWDPSRLSRLAVAWVSPTGIGLSSLAGYCWPQSPGPPDGGALLLELGEGGASILAPLAPGLVVQVPVRGVQILGPGEEVVFARHSCVIALDGEREVEVGGGDVWMLSFNPDGPRVVDIGAAVQEAARRGILGRVDKLFKNTNLGGE
ncbi:MAG: ATP-NAD kinase family protein [Bacillota bacterium]